MEEDNADLVMYFENNDFLVTSNELVVDYSVVVLGAAVGEVLFALKFEIGYTIC